MPGESPLSVLVVFTGGYPGDSVYAHRVHLLCRGLAASNLDVQVLIPHPTENIEKPASGHFEGISFRYIGGQTLRKKKLFLRKLIDLKNHLQCLTLIFTCSQKHILVVGPSLDFRLWIPIICCFRSKSAVLEINELPFIGRADSRWKSFKRQLFLYLILPRYSGFISISSNLSELIRRYKNRRAWVAQIPILIDPDKTYESATAAANTSYIVHAGSLSEEKDGISGVFSALSILKSEHHQTPNLIITGRVSKNIQTDLFQKAAMLGLDRQLQFRGFLTENELYQLIAGSRLAIINRKNTLQNQYCFPTKLGLYLINAVPVVTTTVGEPARFLQHDHHACLMTPDQPRALAAAMSELLNNPEKAKKMGQTGRMLCFSAFNYRVQGQVLAEFLTKKPSHFKP